MKFKLNLNYSFELGSEEILDLVNNFQEVHNLEIFEIFEDIPKELILLVLNSDFDEMEYQLSCISPENFFITGDGIL